MWESGELSPPTPNKKAYYLSHNGLGDNISNIGAVNFLLQYYDIIYFICRDYYKPNVELFMTNPRVVLVPVNAVGENSKQELNGCNELLSRLDKNEYDIFVSGLHRSYISSHITRPEIINRVQNDKYILIWKHLHTFYHDNHLDTSIYIDYFDFPSCEISTNLYEKIAKYQIVFIHSYGIKRGIDIASIVSRFIYREDCIIICSDKNVYDRGHPKYELAQEFVNIKIAYYIDVIRNATYIHIIDSCFCCIVYPLLVGKKIAPKECVIYPICTIENVQLVYTPLKDFVMELSQVQCIAEKCTRYNIEDGDTWRSMVDGN